MQFTTLALFSLASMALAAPSAVDKRDGLTIRVCSEQNFGGHCTNIAVTIGKCQSFDTDMNNNAESLKPDVGLSCSFFKEPKCNSHKGSFTVNSAGWWDLRRVVIGGQNENGGDKTRNYQNKLTSFRCEVDNGTAQ
ncbi:hypothetical protein J1614_001552 [Plenodomus biglobosus]|nr:hypothetical protein J1614_001552 [Plenodomus biglobosus]